MTDQIEQQATNQKSTVTLQVVLEYHWTSSRDLISDVKAALVTDNDDRKDGEVAQGSSSANEGNIMLSSVIESLADKGFELEPEHRVSYRDPTKQLNVYVGKVSDTELITSYSLPASSLDVSDAYGAKTLTLLLREPGLGMSA